MLDLTPLQKATLDSIKLMAVNGFIRRCKERPEFKKQPDTVMDSVRDEIMNEILPERQSFNHRLNGKNRRHV